MRGAALVVMLGFAGPVVVADDLPPALVSLVASERRFARTSVEKGQREAFLAFFADDGIAFGPHPVVYKEDAARRPAPATRPSFILNWEPLAGDVSAAGDLGYTTGPYRFSDQSAQPRPPVYGHYFSIWKVQADGTWKVVLDLGVDTPTQEPDALRPRFRAAPGAAAPPGAGDVAALRSATLEREREASRAAAERGLEGRLEWLDGDARLHRNGSQPVVGRDTIRALLAATPEPMSWAPIRADVARSGDLGYSYGSYELKGGLIGPTAQQGYYVHVWRRTAGGDWRIVVDVARPLPAEAKAP